MSRTMLRGLLGVAVLLAVAAAAQADVFNMGGTRNADGTWTGLASLEFVPVGNPGNASDPETGRGSVADPYWIGKYEITNAQWREFLAAKARTSDPYGLYNTAMAGWASGIDRTWNVDHYEYTAKGGDANWDNRPVNWVNFWDAARFCNWLHNGQGNGDTETGAYLNIGNPTTFARQPGAKYFIPTENQWYKAAYFDPGKGGAGVPGYWDFPMRSDRPNLPSNDLTDPDGGNNANFYLGGSTISSPYYTTVVGDFENSASAYGTFDQGGNIYEWNDVPGATSSRMMRGGAFGYYTGDLQVDWPSFREPAYDSPYVGLRVATVPEPGSIALLLAAAAGLLMWRVRRR